MGNSKKRVAMMVASTVLIPLGKWLLSEWMEKHQEKRREGELDETYIEMGRAYADQYTREGKHPLNASS